MKKTILFIGTLMVLANACVKEADNNETYRPVGTPIVFGAATGYENGDGTRTIYSGDLYGTTNQYERIDWVANDPIKVYYGTDNGVYTVNGSSITAASENSNAGVTFSSGTQLTWSSQSNHLFYAVYPSSATLNAAGHVSGSIPATQTVTYNSTKGKYLPDMSHAYLVSRKTITSSSTESTVNLPFTPAYTAFEFNLTKPGTAAITVTKLELISTGNLVGTFALDIDGENAKGATWSVAPTVTGAGTTATVNIPGGGKVLSTATDVLNVTVLALPVEITGLTVKLTMTDESSVSLPLKDNATTFHTFAPCKKYVISNTNVPGQWTYTVEPIADETLYGHGAAQYGFNVRSYRTDMNGNTQAVTWKAQYSIDGVNWTDTPPAGSSIEDFTVTTATGNGVAGPTATPESRTVDLVANTHYTQSGAQTSTEILRSRTAVSNYDLSTHDIHGSTIPQTTANTYVVSAPGTYTFPCIYGNARKNGQDYTDCYTGGSFRNAVNAGIVNPSVYFDLYAGYHMSFEGEDAVVVWQDEQIITTQPSLRLVGGYWWIDFEIKAADIRPGNAVIAVRAKVKDSTGGTVLKDHSILWSWQIWVTEKDLHPVTVSGQQFMPYNLGWNVDGEVQTRQYTDRECFVRIQQIAPSDDPTGAIQYEDFEVEQLAGAAEILEQNIGSNPFYQWGRKDPMIPGQYSTTMNERGDYCADRTIYPGSDYSSMSSETKDPGTPNYVEMGLGIRNPHVGYQHSVTTGWIGGATTVPGIAPYNLWDKTISLTDANTHAISGEKIKTVYDPCPVGFTVPTDNALESLGNGSYTAGQGGRYFNTLFMPFAGARIFYNRIAWGEYSAINPGPSITPHLFLRHVNQIGLYWTDTPVSGLVNSQIMLFEDDDLHFQSYTRGTAASIRPMVDPRF